LIFGEIKALYMAVDNLFHHVIQMVLYMMKEIWMSFLLNTKMYGFMNPLRVVINLRSFGNN